MEVSSKLKQAITAIKTGDKATGQRVLTEILRVEPDNEDAWLWMSSIEDSDEHRRQCLENVLKINPENKLAQQGLSILRQKQPHSAVQSCLNCGKPIKGDNQFCQHCGSDLKSISIEQQCPHCNKVIDSGSKFCPHCGSRLTPTTKNEQLPQNTGRYGLANRIQSKDMPTQSQVGQASKSAIIKEMKLLIVSLLRVDKV